MELYKHTTKYYICFTIILHFYKLVEFVIFNAKIYLYIICLNKHKEGEIKMLKNKRILLTILVALLLLLIPTMVNATDGEVNITSIEVTAPQSGAYAAGQQITIRMTFDKAVKGTMPELDIYFGVADSKELTVPAATTPVTYVDYTYTIAAEDNGILRLYGPGTDAELKDENDNELYLNKIYDLTGNTIYAENAITRADLSNAEFEWVPNAEYNNSYLKLQMKNATTIKDNAYLVHFSHNKNEQISALDYENIDVFNKTINTDGNIIFNVEDLAAESGDLYIWVCEVDKTTRVPKMLLSAKKVERLTQLPLGTRIKIYFFSDYTSSFCYEPLGDDNRKINVKIGHVTDINILKSIKNGEAGCLQNLLTYAKSNEGFYTCQIPVGDYDSVISNVNLLNEEYYYVYMSVEDKDGKYYPIEDVSLYQGCVGDSIGVNLFDYMDDSFRWNLDEEEAGDEGKEPTPAPAPEVEKEQEKSEDKTTAPGSLPYTGGTFVIIASVLAIVIMGIYAYKRNKDLRGI